MLTLSPEAALLNAFTTLLTLVMSLSLYWQPLLLTVAVPTGVGSAVGVAVVSTVLVSALCWPRSLAYSLTPYTGVDAAGASAPACLWPARAPLIDGAGRRDGLPRRPCPLSDA